MKDADGPEDAESYILSSKYRSRVLAHLAGTVRATPNEIADSVDAPRPHISRALSELQERGVVELRVPEARSVGRYYGLTETGEAAWPDIKREIRSVDWTVEDPSTQAMRAVVELSEDEFDDALRFVGVYDGTEVTIVQADPAVFSRYSDEEFEDGLRTLIFDHSLDEVSMPSDDCWSEVLHFTEFSVLRVRVPDGSTVAISFDGDHDVAVPDFAEAVSAAFEQ